MFDSGYGNAQQSHLCRIAFLCCAFCILSLPLTANEDSLSKIEHGNVHFALYNYQYFGQFELQKASLIARLADSLLQNEFPDLHVVVFVYPYTLRDNSLYAERLNIGYEMVKWRPYRVPANNINLQLEFEALEIFYKKPYIDIDEVLHLIYASAHHISDIKKRQDGEISPLYRSFSFPDSIQSVKPEYIEELLHQRYPQVSECLAQTHPFEKVVLNRYDSIMIDYVNEKYCLYEYEKVINAHFNSEDKSVTKETAPDYFLRVNDLKEFSNNSFPFLFTDDSTMYVVGYNYPVSSPPIHIPCIESPRYLFHEHSISFGIGDEQHYVLNMHFPRNQMYVLYFSDQHKVISDYHGDVFFPQDDEAPSSLRAVKTINPLALPCMALFILCCILVVGSGRNRQTSC